MKVFQEDASYYKAILSRALDPFVKYEGKAIIQTLASSYISSGE